MIMMKDDDKVAQLVKAIRKKGRNLVYKGTFSCRCCGVIGEGLFDSRMFDVSKAAGISAGEVWRHSKPLPWEKVPNMWGTQLGVHFQQARHWSGKKMAAGITKVLGTTPGAETEPLAR